MGTLSKTTTIGFVRASYWAGAVFDALVLVPMLSPDVARTVFGMRNFNPGKDYRYAMYIAASLMLGWVGLLIWADRKPLERRGVLLWTIVPVLFGLVASGFYAVSSGLIPIGNMLPTWIVQGVFILLYGFSYLSAGRADAMLGEGARSAQ